MRRRMFVLALLLAFIPGLASAQAQQPDRRPGFAVFPFYNGGSYGLGREDLEALGVGVQQMLLTELSQNTALRIVERSALRAILEEQGLLAQGRVDPQQAARIGKIVGARYALIGGFVDLNGDFRLDGRIVDVETTEVVKAEQLRGPRNDLYDMMVEFAGKVTANVQLPALPEPVREARKARDIPEEAFRMYARAVVYQDTGNKDRAIALYRQIADRFPVMTEATEALRQLTGG